MNHEECKIWLQILALPLRRFAGNGAHPMVQGRKAGIMKHCASLTPVPCSLCPLTASLGYFDRKEFQGPLFFHWLTVVIHYIMRLR